MLKILSNIRNRPSVNMTPFDSVVNARKDNNASKL
jgi:hypothetical protein